MVIISPSECDIKVDYSINLKTMTNLIWNILKNKAKLLIQTQPTHMGWLQSSSFPIVTNFYYCNYKIQLKIILHMIFLFSHNPSTFFCKIY